MSFSGHAFDGHNYDNICEKCWILDVTLIRNQGTSLNHEGQQGFKALSRAAHGTLTSEG